MQGISKGSYHDKCHDQFCSGGNSQCKRSGDRIMKKVCKRYPDNASPPPRIAAAIALGKRIPITISVKVSSAPFPHSIFGISETGIFTLPMHIFKTKNKNNKAARMINAAPYLLFFIVSLHLIQISQVCIVSGQHFSNIGCDCPKFHC